MKYSFKPWAWIIIYSFLFFSLSNLKIKTLKLFTIDSFLIGQKRSFLYVIFIYFCIFLDSIIINLINSAIRNFIFFLWENLSRNLRLKKMRLFTSNYVLIIFKSYNVRINIVSRTYLLLFIIRSTSKFVIFFIFSDFEPNVPQVVYLI